MNFHWRGKIEIETWSDDGTCTNKQEIELLAENSPALKEALLEYVRRSIKAAE